MNRSLQESGAVIGCRLPPSPPCSPQWRKSWQRNITHCSVPASCWCSACRRRFATSISAMSSRASIFSPSSCWRSSPPPFSSPPFRCCATAAPFGKLRGHGRTVLMMNVTTALAWSCYFFGLSHLEPSIVNTLHSGMGPLTVVALAAFGVRLAKTEHVGWAEYLGYAGIALSLVALAGSCCRAIPAWRPASETMALLGPRGAARQRRLDHREPALLQAAARSRRQRRGRDLGALCAADPDRGRRGLAQGRARRHRHGRRGRDADGARHHPDRAAALCVPGRHRADRAAHRQRAARARAGVRVRAAADRRPAHLFDADADRHPGLFGRRDRQQRGACPRRCQPASDSRASAPGRLRLRRLPAAR